MEESEISEVAKILNEWNPLGDEAANVPDLDGYRSESIDILFHLEPENGKAGAENVIMQVLNEAFNIDLTRNDCSDAASKILRILSKKH
jgi:hypothetical protein